MTNIKNLIESFTDKKLIEQALTHRSWVNENKNLRGTNERLEFLGDAILEYVVSDFLYKKFTDKDEGFLTALRANVVNTINLARVGRKLKIGEALSLSRGEEETGGRTNTSLLADTIEAIIGAIFIDSGIDQAKKFIEKNILNEIDNIVKKPLKDAKSTLQEKIQSDGYLTPKYQIKKETGPDHNKKFVVEVSVNGKVLSQGEGKSKAIAEQEAAKKALTSL